MMKFIRMFLFILILIGVGLLLTQKHWVPPLVDYIISKEKMAEVAKVPAEVSEDGMYCFSRAQLATATEPYEVHEKVVLNIAGENVTGKKDGTQAGPDMTNGYTGTLSGTKNKNNLELVYSYTVEGSQNKEHEVYKFSPEVLTKLRWVLHEENGILVPDRVGEPKLIVYNKEACE